MATSYTNLLTGPTSMEHERLYLGIVDGSVLVSLRKILIYLKDEELDFSNCPPEESETHILNV